MLLKRAFVAVKHEVQTSQQHVYFQYAADGDDSREGIYITRLNWDEMGQPERLTVTVEGGHNLDEAELQRNLLDKIPSRMPTVPMNFGINP